MTPNYQQIIIKKNKITTLKDKQKMQLMKSSASQKTRLVGLFISHLPKIFIILMLDYNYSCFPFITQPLFCQMSWISADHNNNQSVK